MLYSTYNTHMITFAPLKYVFDRSLRSVVLDYDVETSRLGAVGHRNFYGGPTAGTYVGLML